MAPPRMSVCKSFSSLFKGSSLKFGKSWVSNQHRRGLYDVIIVGGGMVGSALACALGSDSKLQDKKILVLEAGDKVKLEENLGLYSNRVSTISPGSQNLLENIGAWKHIENMRAKSFRRMQVWDACGDGYVTFEGSDDLQHEVVMGHVVENNVLVKALELQLEELKSKIDVLYKTKLKEIQIPWDNENCNWIEIALEDGQTLSTRLLVGADGHNSFTRKQADVECITYDYKQNGVVATLGISETTDNNVAWQRFLPNGPIALLPLTTNKSSLVWSTTTEEAMKLVSLPERQFVETLNEALTGDLENNSISRMASHLMHNAISTIQPDYLGLQMPPKIEYVEENSLASFPLGLNQASYYVKHRLALIGDAAHRIHPLAGQGVNLGFSDVQCLVKELRLAAVDGQDIVKP
ncbi:ubiquinone biosynthesis monooxygenase COQ6, mitochondrial-like isoform X2 [Xenia sp. Carnegie-2017]|uniref:ubiquinone biosynthesis monooxygenase COQ6, mitochondrial-like isoform X2 n=1 Tax=Xenia sp. Carnegie-2017 TaxID=2897299 RepID=UPI001F04D53E|nr:ubiquinone biosynthesis monooxygenase COQ6, mitochondrial-like isoform X2 [Xenia sp. Carnegie-2017]